MSQEEATKAPISPGSTTEKKVPWIVHILAVFFLGVLFSYLFMPHYAQLAFVLAGVLWYLTWHDWCRQEIDIRVAGLLLLVGLLVHGEHPLFYLYLACVGFLLPHLIQEAAAKVMEPGEEEEPGSFQYEGARGEDGGSMVPAYLPIFTGTLAVILTYYMLVFPLPERLSSLLFDPVPYREIPGFLWLIPMVLLLLSYGFYRRNKKAMEKGRVVVYRGFGDGDIYFFGAMAGVFGFFLTLFTVSLSMVPAYLILRRCSRQDDRRMPSQSGGNL